MHSPETSPAVQERDDGPRPAYFLTRGDDQYTPLIALDELPEWITIEGLPRSIPVGDLLKWKPLGSFATSSKSDCPYTVSIQGFRKESNDNSDSECDSDKVPSTRVLNARLARDLNLNDKNGDLGRNGNHSLTRNGRTKGTRQQYNPTTPGIFGKKKYCTHWMRTGECDFTQQGCMYLHEMPDLTDMEKMGYTQYPRWFRERDRNFQTTHSKDFDATFLVNQGHRPPKSPPRATRGLGREKSYPQDAREYVIGSYNGMHARGGPWYRPTFSPAPPPHPFGLPGQTGPIFPGYSPADKPISRAVEETPNGRVWSVKSSEGSSKDTTKHDIISNSYPVATRRGALASSRDIRLDPIVTTSSANPSSIPQIDSNDRSLFSCEASPDSFLSAKYPKMQPSDPSASRFDQPSVATAFASKPNHNAMNAPPTPEQKYIKRFVNTNANTNTAELPAQEKQHVAPDAKVAKFNSRNSSANSSGTGNTAPAGAAAAMVPTTTKTTSALTESKHAPSSSPVASAGAGAVNGSGHGHKHRGRGGAGGARYVRSAAPRVLTSPGSGKKKGSGAAKLASLDTRVQKEREVAPLLEFSPTRE